ncbi:hypothetical protein AS657_11445 [Serratia marcescens]|nr:hypothetical protein AS657_11445 [Serratia marcescens]BEO32856.1 hypothetical protein SMQE01_16210 [Serratia marcescens]
MQAHGRGPQGEFEAQYHYDALGRRSRKTVHYKGKTEQTTRFLWQGYRLLQEQRDDGSRRSWSYDLFWCYIDRISALLEVSNTVYNLGG